LAIAGLSVAAGLPWLTFGLFSGAVVDRFDRRQLMWVFDLGRTLVVASLAAFLALGGDSLFVLYLVVFLIGVGETIVDTSAQAILPALVPLEELDRANGRLFSTQTVAHRFVGPPVGGFLFGIAATLPVAADAVSFGVASVLMMMLGGRFRADNEPEAAKVSIGASTAEGFRWLRRTRPILAFAIGAAVLNVGIVAGESILVLFAEDQLALSGVGYGALLAATAVGYTLGAGIVGRLVSRVRRLPVILGSVAAVGFCLGGIAVSQHWAVAAAALFGIGVASGFWDVIAVSYRQSAVPDRLLGRIMAAYRVIAFGAVPVGALVGGVGARFAGNRAPFLTGAVLVLLLIPYLMFELHGVELDPTGLQGDGIAG
jgi:MFS family permease